MIAYLKTRSVRLFSVKHIAFVRHGPIPSIGGPELTAT
jgi:hypothetical protein